MCEVLRTTSNMAGMNNHVKHVKMLGLLRSRLKRKISEENFSVQPAKKQKSTLEGTPSPTVPLYVGEVTVDECFQIKRGQISCFDELKTKALFTNVMTTLQKKLTHAETAVVQSLDYFKHICQFPNQSMLFTSRTFWINQVFTEAKHMIIEFPKIVKEHKVMDLIFLFLHILFKDHFKSWFPLEASSDRKFIDQLKKIRSLLHNQNDIQQFYKLTEIHVGHQIRQVFENVSSVKKYNQTLVTLFQCCLRLFSDEYQQYLIEFSAVPLLRSEISSWTFPEAVLLVGSTLKPWQSLVGTNRMQALQVHLSQTVFAALECSGEWKPSDSRVRVLVHGLSPFLDSETVDAFLTKHALPAINKELGDLGMMSAPLDKNIRTRVQNIFRWDVLFPEEALETALVVHFLPRMVLALSEWLMKKPSPSRVSTHCSNITAMIPANMRDIICVERYLILLNDIMQRYQKVCKKSTPHQVDIKNSGDEMEPLNLCKKEEHTKQEVQTPEPSQPLQIVEEIQVPKLIESNPVEDEVRSGPTEITSDKENQDQELYDAETSSLSRPSPPVSPDTPSIPALQHLQSSLIQIQQKQSKAVTYRQLLAEKADKLGLSFGVIPKKFENGSQLYRFGCLKLYIKNGLVNLQKIDGTWEQTNISGIHTFIQY